MRITMFRNCLNLLLILISFSINATLYMGAPQALDEVDPNTSIIVDAFAPQNQDTLLISKHGKPSEVLNYQISYDNNGYSVVLIGRQQFNGFAPVLFEDRDFVFAFKPLSEGAGEKAALFVLDENNQFQ